MIVLDASALVEALVGADPDPELFARLDDEVHAPHLIDVEVLSVLRRLELGRVIDPSRAAAAVQNHWSLTIMRYDSWPLSSRVWSLRHQFTAHDATYIALAEALGAPLVTCDRKLAAAGHGAQVEVMERRP